MINTPLASLSLSLLIFTVPVLGQTFKDENGETQFLPPMTWENAFQNVNASAVPIKVDGYNMTKPYPGDLMTGEWDMQLNVVGNIPITSYDKGLTAARMSYTPPDTLTDSRADGSWGTCVNIKAIDIGDKDVINSNCDGVLSTGCLDKLRASIQNSGQCWGEDIPQECSKEFEDASGVVAFGGPSSLENNTYGGSMQSINDFKAYDSLTRKAHVMMITFSAWKNFTTGEKDNDAERLPGILACMRPDQFAQGSRTYESKAVALKITPLITVLSLAVVSGILA